MISSISFNLSKNIKEKKVNTILSHFKKKIYNNIFYTVIIFCHFFNKIRKNIRNPLQAVGDQEFVMETKAKLGAKAIGRRELENNEGYELKEPQRVGS